MSDPKEPFRANIQQAEYRNLEHGRKWVQRDAEMDVRLSPLIDGMIVLGATVQYVATGK